MNSRNIRLRRSTLKSKTVEPLVLLITEYISPPKQGSQRTVRALALIKTRDLHDYFPYCTSFFSAGEKSASFPILLAENSQQSIIGGKYKDRGNLLYSDLPDWYAHKTKGYKMVGTRGEGCLVARK